MDLSFSELHRTVRNQVRTWIDANLDHTWSEALRDPSISEHELMELRRGWQRELDAAGYLGMRWPREWGGRGASGVEEAILAEELASAEAPELLDGLGLGLRAPALMHHDMEAQRRRCIPAMKCDLSEPLGSARSLDAIDEWAALGAAAIALGLAEAALERSVAYARQRETFGKPIGVYQVLQHRIADMLLRTESSRSAVYRAAWALARGEADSSLVVAAAKAYAVESACGVTRDSVQIHAGNGFTWEYDLHCFLKRAMTLDQHYGSTAVATERALRAFEASL